MKCSRIDLIAFITASAIGVAAFLGISQLSAYWSDILNTAEHFDAVSVTAPALEPLEVAVVVREELPIYDPEKNYVDELPVKLLQTGALHAEEVSKEIGGPWIGLFRVGERYELERTRVEARPVDDDRLFDREIVTSVQDQAVFLLHGATGLEPGTVTTVYEADPDSDLRFPRDKFTLGVSSLRLWTEKTSPEGFPLNGSVLMMQYSGYDAQVLRSLPNGCDDCSWKLLWVGDFDGDSKLDFLVDLSDHYNVRHPVLFLCSEGIYAAFHGVGC